MKKRAIVAASCTQSRRGINGRQTGTSGGFDDAVFGPECRE
ncbi:MAG: hypothetical protein NTY17_15625 [Planctomycetia bacterium]|jgi:hypothetical protein|nr:hypothetical protein [Planctomycetia bacterium]